MQLTYMGSYSKKYKRRNRGSKEKKERNVNKMCFKKQVITVGN